MSERVTLQLPAGRLISGSVSEKRTTDYQNQPIAPDKQGFDFGIAIQKSAPGINEIIGAYYQKAVADFQGNQGVLQQIQMGLGAPEFSWKIKDGDLPNREGSINENSRGCWVFYLSSIYAPTCSNAQNIQIDPAQVKRGYFVDAQISIKGNGNSGRTAGLFASGNIVRLLGYGPEIIGGVSPTVMGAAPDTSHLPGFSAVPVASQAIPQQQPAQGGMPGAGGGMPVQQPHGGMPGAGGMPAQQPAHMQQGGMPGAGGIPQGVTPHHGFVQGPQGNGGMPGMGS